MEKVKVSAISERKKVFYWRYDDKSMAAMVLGKNGRKSKELKSFANKKEFQNFFGSKDEYVLKKLKLSCGIYGHTHDVWGAQIIDKEELKCGFSELEKMLEAYTKKGKERNPCFDD